MNDRKGFGSNFGFLMAAVGSAVGLGNIWGFPNKMGANGGFPFLILYLALALCCGVIIMLGELALGRKTGHGAVGAYQSISKRFNCAIIFVWRCVSSSAAAVAASAILRDFSAARSAAADI